MFEQNREVFLYVATCLIYGGDFGFNLCASARKIFPSLSREGFSSLNCYFCLFASMLLFEVVEVSFS
jgi:hypothetical protein